MPTRLLYVGKGLEQVRLVETDGQHRPYFALSYSLGEVTTYLYNEN